MSSNKQRTIIGAQYLAVPLPFQFKHTSNDTQYQTQQLKEYSHI